jgi:hypothetical protein
LAREKCNATEPVLAPVRNGAVVSFERVTAVSEFEPVSVRTGPSCGPSCVRVNRASEWLVKALRESEMQKHGLVESSRLERGAIVCFLWVRVGSNKRSSRLERGFAIEICARYWAVVAPGRNSPVVCFVEVTSFSTRRAVPGRSALMQIEPFAKIALGKPGRNAITRDEFLVKNALGEPVRSSVARHTDGLACRPSTARPSPICLPCLG